MERFWQHSSTVNSNLPFSLKSVKSILRGPTQSRVIQKAKKRPEEGRDKKQVFQIKQQLQTSQFTISISDLYWFNNQHEFFAVWSRNGLSRAQAGGKGEVFWETSSDSQTCPSCHNQLFLGDRRVFSMIYVKSVWEVFVRIFLLDLNLQQKDDQLLQGWVKGAP